MAGGFTDILALQGVVPVQAPPAAPTSGGLYLGQLTGVWLTHAPVDDAPVVGGMLLGQLTGSWLTHALVDDVIIGKGQHTYDKFNAQALREDEEMLALIRAFVQVIQCRH